MAVFQQLASLALRGAAATVTGAGVEAAEGVYAFLSQRFVDHSRKLTDALASANGRAWDAVELALAGRSWWDAVKVGLASGEDRAFREQVSAFLAAHPLDGVDGHGPDFRGQCLAQLRAARKGKLLSPAPLDAADLARRVGDLSRFGDAAAAVEAEYRVLADVAAALRRGGYAALATFLELRPAGGPPVLVAAFRYFFQREVERNPELFRGLAYSRLEALQAGQDAGFSSLERHADRLGGLMADVAAAVARTHQDVLDMKGELSRQGRQMQELGQAVLSALAQHQLERRELHGGDSLSVRDDEERRLVRDLVRRYRALPPEERREMPALLNAVGKLEVVTGNFEAAEKDFKEVATLVEDPRARAEAAHNAYRAALERRAWDDALTAAREAATLDAARFALFPGEKYEAEKILGAGGFGVAFLCRNRHSGGRVVIKTLRKDGLDRDLSDIFREAQALEELDHPAIIRVRDCDYADGARKKPYFVMDYFAGQALDGHVEQFGTLRPGELLPLAKLVASGLERAHAGGILHRDVKPGNLLVRRNGPGWDAKLIDFGLALRAEQAASTAKASFDRTLAGSSVAGTLDYAAPEQLGKLKGVAVGPYSDVYGFGKTCCFALFGTPSPTYQHWQGLPPELADLLGRCLSDQPRARPQTMTEVLRELGRIGAPVPEARAAEPRRAVERLPTVEEAASPKGGAWAVGVVAWVLAALGVTAGFCLMLMVTRTSVGPPIRPPQVAVTAPPPNVAPVPEEMRPPPNRFTAKELTGAVKELRKGVPVTRLAALASRLADTEPTEEMRARHADTLRLRLQVANKSAPASKLAEAEKQDDLLAVSKALDALLKDAKPDNRLLGVRACQEWGTVENVPELSALAKGVPALKRDIDAARELIAKRGK